MTYASTAGIPFVRTTGLICFVGAVIGVISALVTAYIPPAVSPGWYSYPYDATGFIAIQVVFLLNHALLLVGILGLARSGVVGSSLVGRVGLWVSLAGMAALTLCEVGAMTFVGSRYPGPGTDTMDALFGVASILIGVGLTMAGVAVVRAGKWTGWRRYVTLICGLAVFVIVIPGVFGPFLAGRLVLAVWMIMFMAFGWALATHARNPSGAT